MKKIIIKNFALFPEKILGEGGFSKVYLGINLFNNKKVAIKVDDINNDFLDREKYFITLIRNKIKNKKIASPPKIIDFFKMKNKKFLVLKFYNTSLYDLMRKNNINFDFESIRNIFSPLCKLLKEIHSLGIVHRDVKPDNLMLNTKMDKIILIDFGLVERLKKIKKNEAVGSILFMSQNLHEGKPYTKEDDFISLCYSCMFLMNGGNLPWKGLNIENEKEKFIRIGKIKKIYPIPKEIKKLFC